MPQAQRLKADGATYDNASWSTRCAARPRVDLHRPGAAPDGRAHQHAERPGRRRSAAIAAFAQHDNLEKSFNVALQRSGYTTGFIGKYMNRYEMSSQRNGDHFARRRRCRDGTSFEAVLGGGYHGWGFQSTHLDTGGHVLLRQHPQAAAHRTAPAHRPGYATNVTADKAVRFVQRHRDQDEARTSSRSPSTGRTAR